MANSASPYGELLGARLIYLLVYALRLEAVAWHADEIKLTTLGLLIYLCGVLLSVGPQLASVVVLSRHRQAQQQRNVLDLHKAACDSRTSSAGGEGSEEVDLPVLLRLLQLARSSGGPCPGCQRYVVPLTLTGLVLQLLSGAPSSCLPYGRQLAVVAMLSTIVQRDSFWDVLPQCGAALVLDFVAFLASLLTGRYSAPHQVLQHLMSSVAAGVAVVSLAPLYAGMHSPVSHTPRLALWGAAGAGEGAPGVSSHVVVKQEDGMLLLSAPAPVVPHGVVQSPYRSMKPSYCRKLLLVRLCTAGLLLWGSLLGIEIGMGRGLLGLGLGLAAGSHCDPSSTSSSGGGGDGSYGNSGAAFGCATSLPFTPPVVRLQTAVSSLSSAAVGTLLLINGLMVVRPGRLYSEYGSVINSAVTLLAACGQWARVAAAPRAARHGGELLRMLVTLLANVTANEDPWAMFLAQVVALTGCLVASDASAVGATALRSSAAVLGTNGQQSAAPWRLPLWGLWAWVRPAPGPAPWLRLVAYGTAAVAAAVLYRAFATGKHVVRYRLYRKLYLPAQYGGAYIVVPVPPAEVALIAAACEPPDTPTLPSGVPRLHSSGSSSSRNPSPRRRTDARRSMSLNNMVDAQSSATGWHVSSTSVAALSAAGNLPAIVAAATPAPSAAAAAVAAAPRAVSAPQIRDAFASSLSMRTSWITTGQPNARTSNNRAATAGAAVPDATAAAVAAVAVTVTAPSGRMATVSAAGLDGGGDGSTLRTPASAAASPRMSCAPNSPVSPWNMLDPYVADANQGAWLETDSMYDRHSWRQLHLSTGSEALAAAAAAAAAAVAAQRRAKGALSPPAPGSHRHAPQAGQLLFAEAMSLPAGGLSVGSTLTGVDVGQKQLSCGSVGCTPSGAAGAGGVAGAVEGAGVAGIAAGSGATLDTQAKAESELLLAGALGVDEADIISGKVAFPNVTAVSAGGAAGVPTARELAQPLHVLVSSSTTSASASHAGGQVRAAPSRSPSDMSNLYRSSPLISAALSNSIHTLASSNVQYDIRTTAGSTANATGTPTGSMSTVGTIGGGSFLASVAASMSSQLSGTPLVPVAGLSPGAGGPMGPPTGDRVARLRGAPARAVSDLLAFRQRQLHLMHRPPRRSPSDVSYVGWSGPREAGSASSAGGPGSAQHGAAAWGASASALSPPSASTQLQLQQHHYTRQQQLMLLQQQHMGHELQRPGATTRVIAAGRGAADGEVDGSAEGLGSTASGAGSAGAGRVGAGAAGQAPPHARTAQAGSMLDSMALMLLGPDLITIGGSSGGRPNLLRRSTSTHTSSSNRDPAALMRTWPQPEGQALDPTDPPTAAAAASASADAATISQSPHDEQPSIEAQALSFSQSNLPAMPDQEPQLEPTFDRSTNERSSTECSDMLGLGTASGGRGSALMHSFTLALRATFSRQSASASVSAINLPVTDAGLSSFQQQMYSQERPSQASTTPSSPNFSPMATAAVAVAAAAAAARSTSESQPHSHHLSHLGSGLQEACPPSPDSQHSIARGGRLRAFFRKAAKGEGPRGHSVSKLSGLARRVSSMLSRSRGSHSPSRERALGLTASASHPECPLRMGNDDSNESACDSDVAAAVTGELLHSLPEMRVGGALARAGTDSILGGSSPRRGMQPLRMLYSGTLELPGPPDEDLVRAGRKDKRGGGGNGLLSPRSTTSRFGLRALSGGLKVLRNAVSSTTSLQSARASADADNGTVSLRQQQQQQQQVQQQVHMHAVGAARTFGGSTAVGRRSPLSGPVQHTLHQVERSSAESGSDNTAAGQAATISTQQVVSVDEAAAAASGCAAAAAAVVSSASSSGSRARVAVAAHKLVFNRSPRPQLTQQQRPRKGTHSSSSGSWGLVHQALHAAVPPVRAAMGPWVQGMPSQPPQGALLQQWSPMGAQRAPKPLAVAAAMSIAASGSQSSAPGASTTMSFDNWAAVDDLAALLLGGAGDAGRERGGAGGSTGSSLGLCIIPPTVQLPQSLSSSNAKVLRVVGPMGSASGTVAGAGAPSTAAGGARLQKGAVRAPPCTAAPDMEQAPYSRPDTGMRCPHGARLLPSASSGHSSSSSHAASAIANAQQQQQQQQQQQLVVPLGLQHWQQQQRLGGGLKRHSREQGPPGRSTSVPDLSVVLAGRAQGVLGMVQRDVRRVNSMGKSRLASVYSASQLYVSRDGTGPQQHGDGAQAPPQALPRGAVMQHPSAAGTLHDTGGAPWAADPNGLRACVVQPPVRQAQLPGENAVQAANPATRELPAAAAAAATAAVRSPVETPSQRRSTDAAGSEHVPVRLGLSQDGPFGHVSQAAVGLGPVSEDAGCANASPGQAHCGATGADAAWGGQPEGAWVAGQAQMQAQVQATVFTAAAAVAHFREQQRRGAGAGTGAGSWRSSSRGVVLGWGGAGRGGSPMLPTIYSEADQSSANPLNRLGSKMSNRSVRSASKGSAALADVTFDEECDYVV